MLSLLPTFTIHYLGAGNLIQEVFKSNIYINYGLMCLSLNCRICSYLARKMQNHNNATGSCVTIMLSSNQPHLSLLWFLHFLSNTQILISWIEYMDWWIWRIIIEWVVQIIVWCYTDDYILMVYAILDRYLLEIDACINMQHHSTE